MESKNYSEEIKRRIIELYKEDKTCEEIADEVMFDECAIDIFGKKYVCNGDPDGYHCHDCIVESIEDFLSSLEV